MALCHVLIDGNDVGARANAVVGGTFCSTGNGIGAPLTAAYQPGDAYMGAGIIVSAVGTFDQDQCPVEDKRSDGIVCFNPTSGVLSVWPSGAHAGQFVDVMTDLSRHVPSQSAALALGELMLVNLETA